MPNQKGIAHLLVLFIIVPLILLLGFWLNSKRDNFQISNPTSNPHEVGRRRTALKSCDDRKVFFGRSLVNIEDITGIIPLGNLSPPSHTFPTDHLYFVRELFSGVEDPIEVEIVAPGEVVITEIRSTEEFRDSQSYKKDYSIYFSPCSEFEAYVSHIDRLNSTLQSAVEEGEMDCSMYGTGGSTYTQCSTYLSLDVVEGDVLGYVGGENWRFSFDFGATDMRTKKMDYANPDRWYEKGSHVVCPLNYFELETRTQLQSLVGNGLSEKRTVSPICGKVAQDILGTAQGIWFVEGTTKTYPEDMHLALVHDNVNPTRPVISTGTELSKSGVQTGTYYFEANDVGFINRDFSDISPDGNTYCFENFLDKLGREVEDLIIIMRLENPKTLIAEGIKLNTCSGSSWKFSDNASVFER